MRPTQREVIPVTRLRNRGLTVRPQDNPTDSDLRRVNYRQLQVWAANGTDFAVRDLKGRDITRSVVLDLIRLGSQDGLLKVTQGVLLGLIRQLPVPDVSHNRAEEIVASYNVGMTNQHPTLVVRRYGTSRRLYVPRFGYISLADVWGLVALGVRLVVLAQRDKAMPLSAVPLREPLPDAIEGDLDITHHTLATALIEGVQTAVDSDDVLPLAKLIELLREQ